MSEWFEDAAFWETFYPIMFPEERYEAAAEEVDNIVALTGVQEGRVLDLCCGPGRHTVELAKRGFQVTGVDRTPFRLLCSRTLCVHFCMFRLAQCFACTSQPASHPATQPASHPARPVSQSTSDVIVYVCQ